MPYVKTISDSQEAEIVARIKRGETRKSVAEQLGVSISAVMCALHRNGIPPTFTRPKSPPYHNREWLKAQLESGCSVVEIARQCNVSHSAVNRFVLKYGFTKRGLHIPHVSATYNFDKSQLEVIDGCLLGDGHIGRKKFNPGSARFMLSSTNPNFPSQVSALLFGEDVCKHIAANGQNKAQSRLDKSGLDFGVMRDRWYPAGKKSVPADLVLTPTILRWWYVGDGTLIKRPKQIEVCLCTDSFSQSNNAFLVKRLCDDLSINASFRTPRNRIFISAKHHRKFFTLIGRPLKGYEHKWLSF